MGNVYIIYTLTILGISVHAIWTGCSYAPYIEAFLFAMLLSIVYIPLIIFVKFTKTDLAKLFNVWAGLLLLLISLFAGFNAMTHNLDLKSFACSPTIDQDWGFVYIFIIILLQGVVFTTLYTVLLVKKFIKYFRDKSAKFQ